MRKRRLIIAGSVLVTAVAVWFLCVDWSWFLGHCPHCMCVKHVLQYRVFGIPVHERTLEEETVIQWMATDLGGACQHPELDVFHKHRWWGLCYCAAPCVNGLWNLGSELREESWYDEAAVKRLRALAERDPHFATEFHQRVIRDHDWDYFRAISNQIISPERLRKLEEDAEASGPPEQEK